MVSANAWTNIKWFDSGSKHKSKVRALGKNIHPSQKLRTNYIFRFWVSTISPLNFCKFSEDTFIKQTI